MFKINSIFGFAGEEISADLWDTTVREYLETRKCSITYDTDELRLEHFDANGFEMSPCHFKVEKRTTIEEICKGVKLQSHHNQAKIVRMKDGIIDSIVSPKTKAVTLMCDDKFEYRLVECKLDAISPDDETFYICVQFAGKWPKQRHPILINVTAGDSIATIGMKLCLTISENMERVEIDVLSSDITRRGVSNDILVKPKGSTIPVVIAKFNAVKKIEKP